MTQLLAALISATGVLVAIIAYRRQWLRVGKVYMVVGIDIRVYVGGGTFPRLVMDMVLLNDGAYPVAIISMRGLVRSPRGEQAVLDWSSFVEISTTEKSADEEHAPSDLDRRVMPLVIGARSSLVGSVRFVCGEEFTFGQGKQLIQLAVIGGSHEDCLDDFADTIELSRANADLLMRDATAGGVAQLVVKRQGTRRRRRQWPRRGVGDYAERSRDVRVAPREP